MHMATNGAHRTLMDEWRDLRDHESTRWAELMLAGFKLFFGVWTLFALPMFGRAPSLRNIPWQIGLIFGVWFTVMSVVQTWGALRQVRRLRQAAVFMGLAVWGWLFFVTLFTNAASVLVPVFGEMLIFNGLLLYRVIQLRSQAEQAVATKKIEERIKQALNEEGGRRDQ